VKRKGRAEGRRIERRGEGNDWKERSEEEKKD
jgi:hypothetical protein